MYFLYLPIPLRSKKLILSRSNSPVLLFSKLGVKTEPETVEEKTEVTIQFFAALFPNTVDKKRPAMEANVPLSPTLHTYTVQECDIFKLTCNFNKQLTSTEKTKKQNQT